MTTFTIRPLLLTAVLLQAACAADGAPAGVPTTVGEWRVHVKQYHRWWQSDLDTAHQPVRADSIAFEHDLLVTRTDLGDGRQTIELAPGAGIRPELAGTTYTIVLDGATQEGRDLVVVGREVGSFHIEKGGNMTALFSTAYGFPVDWVIQQDDFRAMSSLPAAGMRRTGTLTPAASLEKTIQHDATGFEISVEVPPSMDSGDGSHVVQTWAPGEKLWRDFTRYRSGHVDVEATVVETL